MKKQRLWCIASVSVLMVLVAVMYFLGDGKTNADMGPKPSIKLSVVNGPEQYYVALLFKPEGEYTVNKDRIFQNDKFDSKMDREFFIEFETDGWRVFSNWVGISIYQKNSKDFYYFSYKVPDPFRVLIVCPDKTTYVSNILDQKEFNVKCTYDVATGELTEQIDPKLADNNDVTVIVNYWYVLFCCVLTLVFELIVLLLFRIPVTKRNLLCFVLINVITNLSYAYFSVNSVSNWNFILRCIIFEVGIAFTEAFFYAIMLRDAEGKRSAEKSFMYGITANLVSAVMGVICIMVYTAIRYIQLYG